MRDNYEAASLVGEVLGAEDSAYALVDERDAIASLWRALPEVERHVISCGSCQTSPSARSVSGSATTETHVSRLLRSAIKHLEDAAAAAEPSSMPASA